MKAGGMTTPRQLKKLYKSGKNISHYLREQKGIQTNTQEILELSYDIQAGVGEATTLSGVLKALPKHIKSYGFDLSWSRVYCAREWLETNDISSTFLCTGELKNIPFMDNSIDIVYTAHSIEPNGGAEEAILKELYRVARKYVILLEPSYELANDKAKQRMLAHGYCQNLIGISEQLGFKIIEHKLFPYSANPLNPTAVTIIEKMTDNSVNDVLACPRYITPLLLKGGHYFSQETQVVYPVLNGIPCLRIDNGILASKF